MSVFLHALNRADVIRVDGGPLLQSYEYDQDDELAIFQWTDGDHEFSVAIPRDGIATAKHEGNGFLAVDVDGEQVKVEVFSLTPQYPVPPALSEGWPAILKKAADEDIIPLAAQELMMIEMVDDFIGGHAATTANNEGLEAQIEALVMATRGRCDELIGELAARLEMNSVYNRQAWTSILVGISVPDCLCQELGRQEKVCTQ